MPDTRQNGDPTENVLNLVEAAIRRQDDLREQERNHLRDVLVLQDEHLEALRIAESKRIDAIREMDAISVRRASEVQATAASVLAKQVVDSAEALRVQVEATRVQSQIALSAEVEPLKKDIGELRRVQYETAGGKAQIVDRRADTSSSRDKTGIIIAAAVGISGFLIGVMGIVLALTLK